MTDTYINQRNKRIKRQEYKELYFFGYGFGTFVTLIFLLKYLTNVDHLNYDKIYIYGIYFGGMILILTIICPYILKYPKIIVNKIIFIIFYSVFLILLMIIYFICITPMSIFIKVKKKPNIKSNFIIKEEESETLVISHNKFYQICQIIEIFLKGKFIILLPSIIMMILIGLLFIFLQSNAVAPFIYSLF